jgi:hypothetical protein
MILEYYNILGHGGLSAISTRPSPTPSTPSSSAESRSSTQNISSCVAGGSGGMNNSMLVMSGGEGYIDFRLGKAFRSLNTNISSYFLLFISLLFFTHFIYTFAWTKNLKINNESYIHNFVFTTPFKLVFIVTSI